MDINHKIFDLKMCSYQYVKSPACLNSHLEILVRISSLCVICNILYKNKIGFIHLFKQRNLFILFSNIQSRTLGCKYTNMCADIKRSLSIT